MVNIDNRRQGQLIHTLPCVMMPIFTPSAACIGFLANQSVSGDLVSSSLLMHLSKPKQ